jgi:hypothetical protein
LSIRERTWINSHGKRRQAIVVNYTDANGDRRLKTFQRRKDAERFAALVASPDMMLNLRMVARRLREVNQLLAALADDLMKLGGGK